VGTLRYAGRSCAIVVLLTFAVLSVNIANGPVLGSNSAAHGGLAESTLDNEFFVAGAMLADIDHYLPPGVPMTDSSAFTSGLIQRAKTGSADLKYFAMGWYEHLEQDKQFTVSVANIQAVHPEYTDPEIRLGFDHLSIIQHPTDVNVTFIMNHAEIVEAIRAGFTNISTVQVKQAIWDYVFSEDIQSPGLLILKQFAQVFAALYPEKVDEMRAEYDSYSTRVTAGYFNPFMDGFRYDVQEPEKIWIRNGHEADPTDEVKLTRSRTPVALPQRSPFELC
jgi:hypothetical protein